MDDVEEFAAAVARIGGVRDARVVPMSDADARPSLGEPAFVGPGRGAAVLPLRVRDQPFSLLVDLCEPGDAGWDGHQQQERLREALELLASAAWRIDEAPSPGKRSTDESEPYSTLVTHARAIVVRIGFDGEWAMLSDAITTVLGYPRDIRLPEGLRAAIHPEDRFSAARALLAVRSGQQRAARTTIRVLDTRGHWHDMETVFYDMSEVSGVHAVIAYAIDATEQRAAERWSRAEWKRLRALVRELNAAVLVEDEQDRVVLANDTFATVFGRSNGQAWVDAERHELLEAVVGQSRDQANVRAQLTKIADRRQRCVGYGLELMNGHSLSLDYVPIQDGKADLGALWYFRDVSEFTATQHDLRERNRVLSDAAELRNHFVAAVSHELRTPLTAVASFAEVLRTPDTGALTDQQRAAVDAVERNTRRLMRLVDDLQLITQLERHTLPIDPSPVDVAELVRFAAADHEPEARRHDLTITADVTDGPALTGDPTRLQQLLDNIIGNAVKFTKPEGAVVVRAGYDDGRWLIEVSDTGIGIPVDELPDVTGTFTRGSNALTRRLSGSGLGLAISKTIVELHRGDLEIESTENHGTTVRVSLPTEQEPGR